MVVPQLLEAIQRHNDAVEKKEDSCDLAECPRCGRRCDDFRRHDQRSRTLLYILDRMVHKVSALLSRWWCALCRQTFSLYPPFVLPYKRYVSSVVLERSRRYIDKDDLSYRKAALDDAMAIFHHTDAQEIDERTFNHSTIHRWLKSLGSLERTSREALRLIRSRSPHSDVFRKILPIPPWKYRSPTRHRLLRHARQLFVAEDEYRGVFGASIFPHLATLCSWR